MTDGTDREIPTPDEPKTVVMLFRPERGFDMAWFNAWKEQLLVAAIEISGFAGIAINISEASGNNVELRLAFENEKSVKDWLEAEKHQQLMDELAAVAKDVAERVVPAVIQQELPTLLIHQTVSPEERPEFERWQRELTLASSRHPGFVSRLQVAPGSPFQQDDVATNTWEIAVRFDSKESLAQWHESKDRTDLIDRGASLYSSVKRSIGSNFGGWFEANIRGNTPKSWKQSMVVLLMLYPLVMIEYHWFRTFLNAIGITNVAVNVFIQLIVSVFFLAWPLVPAAGWVLARWLHNDDNSRPLLAVGGTLFVIVLYAILIAVFSLS